MFFLFTYAFLFIFFQISDLFNSRFHEESNLNILDATQVFDSHQIKDYFAFFLLIRSTYTFIVFIYPFSTLSSLLNLRKISLIHPFQQHSSFSYFFNKNNLFVMLNYLFVMLNYLFSLQTKLFYDAELFVRDIYLCYLAYTIKCSRCLMFCSLYIIICSLGLIICS